MYFINHLKKDEWWELDKEKMMVFNFFGGYHYVNEKDIKNSEVLEYENWHELYLAKHYCPIEVDKWTRDVWISPEGKFYNGDAHENRAKEILEIIYGENDIDWAGDRLEEHGWVRATTSLMWDVRFNSWNSKRITQKQYNALWDWCECNRKPFPDGIEVL